MLKHHAITHTGIYKPFPYGISSWFRANLTKVAAVRHTQNKINYPTNLLYLSALYILCFRKKRLTLSSFLAMSSLS